MTERVEFGRCFCSSIILEFRGDPFWICYDHDNDCRRATGAAFNVWVGYRAKQISLLSGSPTRFSRTPGVIRTFCAVCGSSIGYIDQALPDEHYFVIGFFDRPEDFCPAAHAYFAERLPWLNVEDNLPRFEGYSRIRDSGLGTPAERRLNHEAGETTLK